MDKKENVEIVKDELTGDKLLAGHDYDGIQELDNALPKWWVWLFFITIVFSVIYFLSLFVFHTMDTQDEEYNKEMLAASELKNTQTTVPQESTLSLLTDDASLAAGKVIYDKSCLVCHLSKGEGLVGPNLTDQYWMYGGSIEDVIDIIVVGVPSKGMISWKDQLSPKQIQEVSSFILSLQGTNPPNAKEPQGELYNPE
ncbi:MAG: c-type cytochrome [Bacteroidetes bacterium]|nr:c-type cytochrome [Bacteroidota bacterium]MCK5766019.1 c-type cytochrome [Bacteroidales bacterium]